MTDTDDERPALLFIVHPVPSEEHNEFATTNTEQVICPYCGHEETDSWELSSAGGVTACASCGVDYEYSTDTTVTYTTRKIGGAT